MSKKDVEIINKVVEKILKEFDYEIDDILESKKEEIEQKAKDEILENMEEEDSPSIEWIQLVELDRAEAHRNERGDFLSN